MFDQNPLRCRHDVIDIKKVDHFRTDYFCKSCGELIGWTEDTNVKPDTYISGQPRKLTNRERMDLR